MNRIPVSRGPTEAVNSAALTMLYLHVLHVHTAVEIVFNKVIQVVLNCSIAAQMAFKDISFPAPDRPLFSKSNSVIIWTYTCESDVSIPIFNHYNCLTFSWH